MVCLRVIDGHHVFLLVTMTQLSGRIGVQKLEVAQQELPLTDALSSFVVAVVDDDRSVLRSLEYLLESADYTVRLFTSAAGLLDSSELVQIDCLISDIDMPGTDGLELLRLVHEALPGLPVILITGYPERLERFSSFGGSDLRFFTKPFHGPELLAAVGEVLGDA
jgi:FixJ family two-component response regulator